jgi:hypothetical protein
LFQPPPQPPSKPPRESRPKSVIVLVLAVLIIVGVIAVAASRFLNTPSDSPTLHQRISANIVNGLISVQPHHYVYCKLILSSGTDTTVQSSFTVSGSAGNNVEVLVMDQNNFVNWQSKPPSSTYYDSGETTAGTISVSLPDSGIFYLVYSNRSPLSATIQTIATLYYYHS